MKILIIEDDKYKANDIKEFLVSYFPGISYDVAMSYQVGASMALKGTYSIILVDMTLPKFGAVFGSESGTLQKGGELIVNLVEDAELRTKCIILTQYDFFNNETLKEVDSRLAQNCPKTYCCAVKYNSSEDIWKIELKTKIDYVIDTYCR